MRYAHIFVALMLFSAATWAATEEQEAALREIEAFSSMQAKSDPHYRAVESVLLEEINAIVKSSAPREWITIIRRRYVALSEAAHAREEDKLRQEELQLGRGFVGAPAEREAAWKARAQELEDLLKAGKLGPREHALRAVAVARLYLPEDQELRSYSRGVEPRCRLPLHTKWVRSPALNTRNVGTRRRLIFWSGKRPMTAPGSNCAPLGKPSY